jgi:membrane protease YdiL (CAAX protease family)
LTGAPDGGSIPPRPETGPGPVPDAVEPADAEEPAGAAEPSSAEEPAQPRITTFSLEGRAVPALYLVGWVASLLGAGVLFVSLQANVAGAAQWLFLGAMALLAIGLVSAAGSQAIERGRRADLAYRGPSPVLAFLVVVVLTFLVLILVLAPLSALGLDPRSPAATTLNLLLTMALYVGVIRLLVVGTGALAWRDMGVVRPDRRALRDLLLGALVAVPVLVVTLVLGGLLSRFLEPGPSQLPEAVDAAGMLANLVTAAILAPIGEELFFRGFTTTAWARTSGARAAIVRGALFFAVAHVVTLFDASFEAGAQRALFSFLGLLPVSITLGWLFLQRRSLYAAIGLHAAFNAVQVLALAAATLAR